jgi:hypothetical protein
MAIQPSKQAALERLIARLDRRLAKLQKLDNDSACCAGFLSQD